MIESKEQIAGTVERVTFHSSETGWSVLKVAPFNSPTTRVKVVVSQVQVFAGASMKFFGHWVNHQRYGEQFNATEVLEIKPSSTAALQKYLGSGLIKGVGPKTAKKIVNHFGAKTLDIFEHKIEELTRVPSIAEKKLNMIKKSWEEHRSIRDVMIFLQSFGVSTLFAVKIFKQYGNNAIEIVSNNPYQLAQDIYGIGFFSADKIALTLGFQKNGQKRILAGIKHVLAASREEGHCYLTKEQIINKTRGLLQLNDEQNIEEFIAILVHDNEIKSRQIILPQQNYTCYYAKSLYYEEQNLAHKITRLLEHNIPYNLSRVTDWIHRFCQIKKFSLSSEQYASILGIIQKSFAILTGGPGCGKTTTLNVLVHLLIAMHKRTLLAAPTGRAAQRMTELIGLEAKTIHRLLVWEPNKGGFKKDEKNPLNSDFLIVDECSMLDISLASALLQAVPDTMQILFIGDPDQLPSVGAGAVLADLLGSKKIPHFTLTKIFRQAQQSHIITYAHEINHGVIPRIASPIHQPTIWEQPVDCFFIDSEEATQEQLHFIRKAKHTIKRVLNTGNPYLIKTKNKIIGQLNKVNDQITIENLYQTEPCEIDSLSEQILTIPEKFKHVDMEKLALTTSEFDEIKQVLKKVHPWSSLHYGLTALDMIIKLYMGKIHEKLGNTGEIQILSPQVRGSLGCNNLNEIIQEKINPQHQGTIQLKIGERIFRSGDRIIQTRNNYDLNVFNGDIGTIENIDPSDFTCHIKFNSHPLPIQYKREDLTEISLAYAITIHKSQGSEFDSVIIPICSQHFKMLYRNLIYTGITRAKKMAILVGSRRALTVAVKNFDNKKRQTNLQLLIEHNL